MQQDRSDYRGSVHHFSSLPSAEPKRREGGVETDLREKSPSKQRKKEDALKWFAWKGSHSSVCLCISPTDLYICHLFCKVGKVLFLSQIKNVILSQRSKPEATVVQGSISVKNKHLMLFK